MKIAGSFWEISGDHKKGFSKTARQITGCHTHSNLGQFRNYAEKAQDEGIECVITRRFQVEPKNLKFHVSIPGCKFVPGQGFTGEAQFTATHQRIELEWKSGEIESFFGPNHPENFYDQFKRGELRKVQCDVILWRCDVMSQKLTERWFRLIDWQFDPRMCAIYDHFLKSGADPGVLYMTSRGIAIQNARPFDYEWMEQVIMWLKNLLGDDEFSNSLLQKFLGTPVLTGSIDEKHITMLLAVLDGNKSVREKHGNEIRDLIAEIRNLNTQSTQVL